MKYRTLGKTGLRVSEIGFGCWAIGGSGYGPTKDEESLEALEFAFQNGVNFFDTADTYGHGHSENLLARFLKSKDRDEVIIASKVGWDFYHGASRKNFDRDYIRFACDESLKRLGVDVIDVYQLHNPKLDLIKKSEGIGVLDTLKKEGKIRFVGVSVHTEEEALACIQNPLVDSVQLVFNLIDQRMSERVFPEAKKTSTGIIVREPLACGLLSGKYPVGHEFEKTDHRRRWMPERRALDVEKIQKLKQVLSTERLSLAQASLEYILDHEEVSTVIPGAKTKQQAKENIQASSNPRLRIEESDHLRELYLRTPVFKKFL